MYEDRTQNYDPEIHEESTPLLMPHQVSIINTTNETEKQHFCSICTFEVFSSCKITLKLLKTLSIQPW